MRPLLRGVIAAVALSLAPVAVVTTTASSAQAAETVATVTAFGDSIRKRGEAGADFSINGTVDAPAASDGFPPSVGEVVLQRQAAGSKKWKTEARDDTPSYALFLEEKYKTNSKYRLFYTGGTDGDITYQPSVSKVIKVKVYRNFSGKDVSKQQPTVSVKFSPKFGKKKILVQKKKGKKKYKTFKKVKTNNKGKARISAPGSSKGTVYRLVAPGNKQFTSTKAFFTAYRYRSLSRAAR